MYVAKCNQCKRVQGFATVRGLCECGGYLFSEWVIPMPKGCQLDASYRMFCSADANADFLYHVENIHSGAKFTQEYSPALAVAHVTIADSLAAKQKLWEGKQAYPAVAIGSYCES